MQILALPLTDLVSDSRFVQSRGERNGNPVVNVLIFESIMNSDKFGFVSIPIPSILSWAFKIHVKFCVKMVRAES